MMNTAQMDTIPLSSDSESGNEPSKAHARAAKAAPVGPPSEKEEEPVTPTGQLSTAAPGRNCSSAAPQSDAKSSLGPRPDLIPCSEGAKETAGDVIGSEPADEEADEEKQRLIAQVLELQHTLEDLSARVDSVKEENLKLRSENQILGQYIENLMAASSVFQSSTPRMRRKASGPTAASKAAVMKLQQQQQE